jgi:ribulose-5-phosphate 4-epimerase/fuculose-1-phosphate aldolase
MSVAGTIDNATSALADAVLAACRILDGERLTDAFGHLSARTADGRVLLTPRVGPGLVQHASELLVLDLEGAVMDGEQSLVPGESPVHLRVLRARPDLNSVCRFHGPACFAWASLGRPLPATTGLALMLGAEVPVFDVASTVRTDADADRLCAVLGSGTAVLLRGFGAVTAGATVAEAVVRAMFLERAAAAVLQASVAGEAPVYPPEAAAAFAARRDVIDEQIARAWTYLCHKWAS